MRKLLLIMAAGLVVAAGQAEAKSATPVRAADRAAPKAGANQITGLGLIPTLLLSIGVAAWLLNEAQDSSHSP
ncbi:MAG: hypothetical protein JWM33_2187 [Caulobacteraceae bacterium]|nr:hypothetical protein [Caulobacteraceae bacterium]